MKDCLFCTIARGEMDTIFLYEDDDIVAFKDINPQAPMHVLIVPKEHIESAAQLGQGHGSMLEKVFTVAAQLVADAGYGEGYRMVTNIGKHGAQSVPHLHFHVLAGRQMGWPPG